jgi:hypothetical protein
MSRWRKARRGKTPKKAKIRDAIAEALAAGLIYDTGERRGGQTVWAPVPPKASTNGSATTDRDT